MIARRMGREDWAAEDCRSMYAFCALCLSSKREERKDIVSISSDSVAHQMLRDEHNYNKRSVYTQQNLTTS